MLNLFKKLNIISKLGSSLLTSTFKFQHRFSLYSFQTFQISTEERQKLKMRYKKLKQGRLKKSKKEKSIHIKQTKEIIEYEPLTPELKEELDKQVNILDDMTKSSGFLKSPNLMTRFEAYNYMKHLDTSFEGFFFKRDFNLNNFNYYIQVLARQGKVQESENALIKMEEMKIQPNIETYTHLMTCYAREKNITKCEELFDLVKNKKNLTLTKFFYNSLMMAYAKNLKVNESEALMKEMRDEGMEPDVICYTTLIQAYRRAKRYDKCWDLYHEACGTGVADEFLISNMIRICAATHDAEKALNLYQVMEVKGCLKHTMNFNSIIFALSSKMKYAEKALEFFEKMKAMGIKPDMHTYVGVLRATAHLGDIKTANDIVKEIKLLGLQINEYVCNGLIRTYAGACRIKYAKTEHVDAYIKDTWELYKYMENENIPINVQILNAILQVHTFAHKIEMVDGLVLPLFEKHGISMNEFSYEHIFRMLMDLRNHEGILDLYEKMKANNIPLTQKILNVYLQSSVRNDYADGIVEALETLREIKRTPDPYLISLLNKINDLPDRVFVELQNHPAFQMHIKPRQKTFTPAQFREKSRDVPKALFRRDGKRTKLR